MSTSTADLQTQTTESSDASENERTLLVFNLAGVDCGLDVDLIREIVHVPPRITRVPNAPPCMRGVINLRGIIIPVLDCARKMNGGNTGGTSESRIVVVEFEGVLFGVIVDVVREVRSVPKSLIEFGTRKKPCSIGGEYVLGAAKIEDGRLIVLLNLASLSEIDELPGEEN